MPGHLRLRGLILRRSLTCSLATAVCLAASARSAENIFVRDEAKPWPRPLPGHVPVKPGEHPRLFFRKSEIPALRERAKTPEGRQIVERMKQLLDGAQSLRTEDGRYTLWDGAAYGFLWILTGEKKYAGWARQSVQMALDGKLDKDKRYSVSPPNEPMRAGPSLYALCLAYDLCYDAWPEDFRLEFVKWVQTWNQRCKKRGGNVSLERLSMSPDNPNPVSNHYGLQVGGAGVALLALKGDPGVAEEKIERFLKGNERCAFKVMNRDFGEGGYFHEHAGPGVIASTWTFTPWLLAMRVCAGKDYVTPRPNGEWITMRFVMQTVPTAKGPHYMNRAWGSGGYGGDHLLQNGGHHSAYFCQGFGAIRPEYRPAMLWVYNRFVKPKEHEQYRELPAGQESYDCFAYPHRPIFAFVSWPFGVEEQNPAEVLPKVSEDRVMGQYVFRNRWRDEDDIVVAALFAARTKYGDERTGRRLVVRAFKQRYSFSTIVGRDGCRSDCVASGDGSGVCWSDTGQSVAVDFGGASGADGVVVMTGPSANARLDGGRSPTAKAELVDSGGTAFAVLTLSASGKHPAVAAAAEGVTVGGQVFSMQDGRLTIAKMAGPWKGPKFRDVASSATAGTKPGGARKQKEKAKPKKEALPEEVRAEWDGKLLDLAREAVRAGERPSFRLSSMRRRFRVVGVSGTKLRLSGGGLELPYEVSRLKPRDRASLAVAVAKALGTAESAGVAAFYLVATGDSSGAAEWLRSAGRHADEVRKAFGE